MRLIFAIILLLLLLNACKNPGRVDRSDFIITNFLHDISPFTPDSLLNVVIEIPAGTRQKWELNQVTGQIEWEQVSPDSFRVINYLPYPANYGFVPQTLLSEDEKGDGDPVDVFVLGTSIAREKIVTVKIVGIIHMIDNNESDSKLLAVNTSEAGFDVYSHEMLINKYPGVVDILKLWLENYKGHDKVKILSVNDEKDAYRYLKTAINDYFKHR